jgi:predicted ArsR family transcriptional regulator
MDPERLLMPEDVTPLGRSRANVLDMLQAADRPVDVREVAERIGLHPNTARFHLEALVEAGLAVREAEDRETPGRPRIGYRATSDGPAGRRHYRLLAEMLASVITGTMPDPGAVAEQAGHAWGTYLTEQPPPYQRPTSAQAVAKLTATMEDLGFAPQAEAGPDGGTYQLRLRQCPFREVAQQHREVICGLHLGLMRGALELMRAPVTAEGLDPFVEPTLCVARLKARDDRQATRLRAAAQDLGQHGRLAEAEFPGRGQQRERPVRRHRAQPGERRLAARFG